LDIQFEKRGLNYLRRAVREVQNQEQTLELRLPDGMPDIGRVLCGWGQVILRGKEWRSGGFSVSGGLQARVLYVPEDGSDVRCAESWLPFQMSWDLGGETREGVIRAKPLLRFVDARSLSARKMMIRAGVAMLGEALVEDTAQVAVPRIVPEQVQLLQATYPIRVDKAAGEKAFQLDEELTLPSSAPAPGKLIHFCVQPELTETRVSGNRLIFRGNANLHMLYRSEEGQLHTWDFPLPFSQLAELSGVYEDSAQPEVTMAVTSLELDLDEGGHLRLKCGLLGQYGISQREMLDIVEDAYSTRGRAEPQWETLTLPVELDARQEPFSGEQAVHQEADILVDVGFLPDFPRQRRGTAGIEVEIPGQFQALYYSGDGSLQSASARWEGQLPFPAGEETKLLAEPLFRGRAQGSINGDSMQLRSDGALWLRTLTQQSIPMVTGLSLEDTGEKDLGRPSLILRRAGNDRLWDIAKSTGSTMDAIRAANGQDSPQSPEQLLLIPIP